MTEEAVRVAKSGPVSTVFLHRPARRNAVDGPTAAQLAAAFLLYGEGGVFCSGADLTAIGTDRGARARGPGQRGRPGCPAVHRRGGPARRRRLLTAAR